VIFGVLTYYLLPNRPAEAKFLTESEKDWITTQLNSEEDHKHSTHQVSAAGALLHSRVWHLAFAALVHGTIFIRSLLLDASDCENTIERVLQHDGRIPSDCASRKPRTI
jgi:hypothetical protein